MKRTLINIAILSTILGTGMAQAGGWDRSGQDTSIILKEGNLLEVTSVTVAPKVTGVYNTGYGTEIGDVTPDYSFTTFGFRTQVNDNMSLAIIQDEPFGAGVKWTGGAYNGIEAQITSSATTALVSYELDAVTVYGGLKNQTFSASAVLPGYTIDSTPDSSLGYVVGAAFEKPEIAMKVALTYHSSVKHDVAITETTTSYPNTNFDNILTANTPSSFNLDFQTGIAENTLLFGNIRQVKWTQTALTPPIFAAGNSGDSLKKFSRDTTSYSIGLGRKLSDQWSGAVTYGTEAADGTEGGPLGPTDGYSKMGVGVTYTGEQTTVTVGMQKVDMGDSSLPYAEMTNNTTIVTAVKVGHKF